MTYCQKVSGSPSRRHSTPKPNLYDETDHFAREEISGQDNSGWVGPSACQMVHLRSGKRIITCLDGLTTRSRCRISVRCGHVPSRFRYISLPSFLFIAAMSILSLEDYKRYGRQMILDRIGLPGGLDV